MSVRAPRGQILVIVGVALTVLLAVAGLVTDIGLAWAAQQTQRSIADSAALSGGQELQRTGVRAVTAAEREEARGSAMDNLVERTGASGRPTCAAGGAGSADSDGDGKTGYGLDVRNCPLPGTDFSASIVTPSPLCVDCEPERSIMVELRRDNLPTFFSRIFGFESWTTRQTSVAGLSYKAKFALITLRPPRYVTPDNDAHADDVAVDGSGTSLTILKGDVGTNTNHVLSGGGAAVHLDPGYKVHYFDTYQAWPSPPPGKQILNLIQDPNYPIPTPTAPRPNLTVAALDDTACEAMAQSVPPQYEVGGVWVGDLPIEDVTCIQPGNYTFRPRADEGTAMLMEPGVYKFNRGIVIRGALIGGFVPNQPGVAVVFNECNGSSCNLDANNAEIFALNGGDRFHGGGAEAAPAMHNGAPVITGDPNPSLTMTLMVIPDANCEPVQPYPAACNDGGNNTLNMAGGGALYLAGVTYAPSDNIKISGGSSGTGYTGQIVAWTATYSGGTRVIQEYPGFEGNGILRLDAACSGAGPTSMSHASCDP